MLAKFQQDMVRYGLGSVWRAMVECAAVWSGWEGSGAEMRG